MNLDEAITHAEEAGIRLSSDCKTKECGLASDFSNYKRRMEENIESIKKDCI